MRVSAFVSVIAVSSSAIGCAAKAPDRASVSAVAPSPPGSQPRPTERPDGYRPGAYESGYCSLKMDGGHAWLFAPDGQRFLSMGVNAIGGAAAPSDAAI